MLPPQSLEISAEDSSHTTAEPTTYSLLQTPLWSILMHNLEVQSAPQNHASV